MGPDGTRRIFLRQQYDQPHRPGGKFLRYAGSQSMSIVDIADEFDGFHRSASIREVLNRTNHSENPLLVGAGALPRRSAEGDGCASGVSIPFLSGREPSHFEVVLASGGLTTFQS